MGSRGAPYRFVRVDPLDVYARGGEAVRERYQRATRAVACEVGIILGVVRLVNARIVESVFSPQLVPVFVDLLYISLAADQPGDQRAARSVRSHRDVGRHARSSYPDRSALPRQRAVGRYPGRKQCLCKGVVPYHDRSALVVGHQPGDVVRVAPDVHASFGPHRGARPVHALGVYVGRAVTPCDDHPPGAVRDETRVGILTGGAGDENAVPVPVRISRA